MSRRVWSRGVRAALAAVVLVPSSLALARGEDPRVVERLVLFARMNADDARALVRDVTAVLRAHAAVRGTEDSAVRQRLRALVDDDRVLELRLRRGFDEELLEGLFRPGEQAAVHCANDLGITLGECDALLAAASSTRQLLPYLPPDDGTALQGSLRALGVSRRAASEIVEAFRKTVFSVPRAIGRDDAGRELLRLLAACPGAVSEREAQMRAWHVGPTEGMVRCLVATVAAAAGGGREGAMLAERFGLSGGAAADVLRWAAGGPGAGDAAPGAAGAERTAGAGALAEDGDAAEHWRSQARALYRSGRFAEAAVAYANAVELAPVDGPTHAGLGAARLASGDPRGAIEAYRAAVERAPDRPGFWVGLAKAQASAGERAPAVESLRRALALDPQHRTALEGMRALEGAAAGAVPRPPSAGARAAVAVDPAAEPARDDVTSSGARTPAPAAAPVRDDVAPPVARTPAPAAEPGPPPASAPAAPATPAARASATPAARAPSRPARESAATAADPIAAALLALDESGVAGGLGESAEAETAAVPAPPPAPGRAAGRRVEPEAGTPEALPEAPPREAILGAMRGLHAQVAACAPAFHGLARFRIVLDGATGAVRSARLETGPSGTPAGRCMERVVGTATLPRFQRATLSLEYPFVL